MKHTKSAAASSDEISRVSFYARIDEVNVSEGIVRLDCTPVEGGRVFNTLMSSSLNSLRNRWRASFMRRDATGYEPMDLEPVEALIILARVERPEIWESLMEQGTWVRVKIPKNPASSNYNEPFLLDNYIEVEPPASKKLSAIFGMVYWPRATAREVTALLSSIPEVHGVVVHDVGQGSANALFDSSGTAVLYYDAGRGAYQNTKTAPAKLDLCGCRSPVVVLSHWDTDHWRGAEEGSAQLLRSSWVVPDQIIGPSHARFASAILRQNGSISIIKRSSSPIAITASGQQLTLRYATGNKSDRNNSGLSLCFQQSPVPFNPETWFFPADAAYTMCRNAPVAATLLVASHHGAQLKDPTRVPNPSCAHNARLVYSFGPNNSYKHPAQKAMDVHEAAGWTHAGWNQSKPTGLVRTTSTPANGVRQSIVFPSMSLQTAQHFSIVHGDTLGC